MRRRGEAFTIIQRGAPGQEGDPAARAGAPPPEYIVIAENYMTL